MGHRFNRPLLILAGCLAFTGCGKTKGSLTGKVTLNGDSLQSGQVTAFDQENKVVGQAMIQEGKYTMDDLPLGQVTLVVQTHQANGEPIGPGSRATLRPGERPLPSTINRDDDKTLPEGARKARKGLKPVPLKYTSAKESGLSVTVVKGDQPFDIEMTGKGELPRPLPGPKNQPPIGGPRPPIPPR